MGSEYGSCESDLEEAHSNASHLADDEDEAFGVQWSGVSSSDGEDEAFRVQWSGVSSSDGEDDELAASAQAIDNLEVLHGLQEQWPGGFFQVLGDEWEVGRKIAEGAQAEIFEAERTLPDGTKDKWVLKVFKGGCILRGLMDFFPPGMLKNLGPNGRYSNVHCCSMYGGMMLPDGRFAILLKCYWGDLKKLLDLKMRSNRYQSSPFPDMCVVLQIMLDIALGMQALHEDGIVHRDLKASNVLIWPLGDDNDPWHGGKFTCHVTDFECSVGITGTGLWRAPEIISALKRGSLLNQPELVTKKCDVYSFAMTCYEILTGRIPSEGIHDVVLGDSRPVEGIPRNTYDAVLGGSRPVLPEFIDLWMKELLVKCWHHDPLQRPSFEEIVDILKAKSGEGTGDGREPDVLALRSSTWEELNDPRVKVDQDPSMEIPEKFPILKEMLAATLQCCKEEVRNIKRCKDQVDMFKSQCAHLVETLSCEVDNMFHRFQQVCQILKEPVITIAPRHRLELNYWLTCVSFGIHSLVDLTRNFQTVVEMLSECGAKDWWQTALRYSTTPPHLKIPRWSVFGLALQQCQWSMDIAHLAIKEITDVAIGFGDGMFNDPGFHWCEERRRAVLENSDKLSSSLGVVARREAQDRDELLKKVNRFLDKICSKSLQHKACKNEFKLASYLMTKLTGPTPKAEYLPYSFQIDPPICLVSRSPVTAIWCGKMLCHVKKVKAQEHEVRQTMEMDAAPLATVQHPNVVRLIGCTVQTSGQMTGLTEIVTKLVSPFRKKHVRGEATGVVVMELMEGDLRSLMDQRCPNPGPNSRPFPLLVALDIMLQIAEAMRFVHEHKIWHRDLKTTNILFHSASIGALPSYPTLDLDCIRKLDLLHLLTPERFYIVKLADFGLAKYSPTESSHSVDAHTGSPRYMAPEMFYDPKAEVPSEYNWSCDVYSYAMTCSTILTGNEPFHFIEKSTTCKVMASVVDRMAEVQVRPDLGLGDALPSLKSLIERCWDKDPLKRPPFSEICRELWNCKVKATISYLWRRF